MKERRRASVSGLKIVKYRTKRENKRVSFTPAADKQLNLNQNH